jgi:hypothetical protein
MLAARVPRFSLGRLLGETSRTLTRVQASFVNFSLDADERRRRKVISRRTHHSLEHLLRHHPLISREASFARHHAARRATTPAGFGRERGEPRPTSVRRALRRKQARATGLSSIGSGMLKRRLAGLLILGSTVAAVSCIADVSDDSEDVVDDDARLQQGNIIAGHCQEACDAVATGDCDWQDQCSEDDAFHLAYCGHKFLTCDEAEHAADGDLYGRTYCWRGCANLK